MQTTEFSIALHMTSFSSDESPLEVFMHITACVQNNEFVTIDIWAV
jgi:hypothetical protein